MVNEHTSKAIVIEMMWLHRGQPERVPHIDEYNRNTYIYEPQKPRMDLRSARDLATTRARTWAFECSEIPPAPADFVPAVD